MGTAHAQVTGECGMSNTVGDMDAIRNVVLHTAMALDAEEFSEWLNYFESNATYEIRAYSTELRRWTIWQRSDRAILEKMLAEVNEHVRDPAQRRHILSSPVVEIDGNEATARSQFSLFRTSPEGQSALYMVGVYKDRLVKQNGRWLYREHSVILDTRMLDMFTHIPV